MPMTERVVETDKTHQRVEAEKGGRGIQVCLGHEAAEVSPALEREAALELLEQLRERFSSLRPFLAAAERVGGAEAKVRVARAAGAPPALLHSLEQEVQTAQRVWEQLGQPDEPEAMAALEAYARLQAIVARDPRG
jgi:hypothetical protein